MEHKLFLTVTKFNIKIINIIIALLDNVTIAERTANGFEIIISDEFWQVMLETGNLYLEHRRESKLIDSIDISSISRV